QPTPRIPPRRRTLPGLDPPRLLVEQADVGEGAARINADAPSCHAVPCLPTHAGTDVSTAVPLIVRPQTIIHIGDGSPPNRRGHRRLISIVSVSFEFLALPAHTPRLEIGVATFRVKSEGNKHE